MTQYDHLFSSRMQSIKANAIREILKVVGQPGMVSLAGGLPAPESFPMGIFEELLTDVLSKYGSRALQYDATVGFTPLREALTVQMQSRGIVVDVDNVAIFSGSQNLLDCMGKILISPGDVVAIEAPSYLGAISAFNAYEPRYVTIATDADGIIPDALEAALKQHPIKFVYLVPTFQNPTGRTLSIERRQQVAALAQRYQVIILEDDPYSALRYSGEPVPTVQQFAPDYVVYAGTFSKTLAPGLRVGFCAAPQPIAEKLALVKQGLDLHTSTLSQALASEYLIGQHMARHLPNIINLYKPRRDAMLAAMDAHFPKAYAWTRPDGGMFIWAHGPQDIDAEVLYWKAVEQKVAFVPGKFFYANEASADTSTMRLNFTHVNEDAIDAAIAALGGVVDEALINA